VAAGGTSAAGDSSEPEGATSSYVQSQVIRLCRIFYPFLPEEVDISICVILIEKYSLFDLFLFDTNRGGGEGGKKFLPFPVATAYCGTDVFVWWRGGNSTFPSSSPSAELRLVIFCMYKITENRINNLNSSRSRLSLQRFFFTHFLLKMTYYSLQ
jgi:hypothetical protein